MGEIKIGINVKRNRNAKLVSMESAERRKSKMQYNFSGRGEADCGSCVTPLPNNVEFSRNTDCCDVEPITYFPFVLRLAAHRTCICQLKSSGVFFPDVGFGKGGTNKN